MRSARDFLRRHRTAIVALAVFNLVFFFPLWFMGRLLSPNDIFFNYSPWSAVRDAEAAPTQNSLLNDLPTGYYAMMSLVGGEPGLFHWDPYVGSGIPGFGSAAAAVLSPIVLLPLLLLPLSWIYTALAFIKLNLAFVFAYLWLREEGLGRNGAAVGAIVVAGAGAYTVRWLWQITSATALYPALLWATVRAFNGRRVAAAAAALIAFAYAVSGFPAAVAYGAWVVILRALALLVPRLRTPRLRRRLRSLAAPAAGVVIGLLLAIPPLVPFVQFMSRSGYLEVRRDVSLANVYPPSVMEGFVRPDRLGNPAYRNWTGDPSLGVLNNYVEATVYAGLLTLVLAAAGAFNRRARGRWFWLAILLLTLGAMFGVSWIAGPLAEVPGIRYSALARLTLVLPLPLGYLAGAARLKKGWAFSAAAAVIAFDLALFAGRFHPYLPPRQADVPPTPMVRFLQAERDPFRVAPFFDYLWPNSAELVRVEDVRSHFGSEAAYRRMVTRVDPTAWSGKSTLLLFNSLTYRFDDPINGLLGIRWYVEHRPIDIVKWRTFEATVPGTENVGGLPFRSGDVVERSITVEAEPFWAVEIPVFVERAAPHGRLRAAVLRDGVVLWSRAFTAEEARPLEKIYLPVRPHARYGNTFTVRIAVEGMEGKFARGINPRQGESPLYYARVMTPVVFERELPDGRLFRNLSELPRFRAVSRVRKMNDEEFLRATDVDFEMEAVITDDPVMPPESLTPGARATLVHYSPAEQRVVTESAGAFFLASSEKLTPELGVTIDGREVQPVETDLLFAGVPVPAGRHEVVFTRRIARGWWWAGLAGAVLFLVALAGDVVAWRRRRNGGVGG